MVHHLSSSTSLRTGWFRVLSRTAAAILLFELLSGLAVTLGPFHRAVEWGVLLHPIIGVLAIAPLAWYCMQHWQEYRGQALSDVLLLGTLVWSRASSRFVAAVRLASISPRDDVVVSAIPHLSGRNPAPERLRAGEPRHSCRRRWWLPETCCKPPHWVVPMNVAPRRLPPA